MLQNNVYTINIGYLNEYASTCKLHISANPNPNPVILCAEIGTRSQMRGEGTRTAPPSCQTTRGMTRIVLCPSSISASIPTSTKVHSCFVLFIHPYVLTNYIFCMRYFPLTFNEKGIKTCQYLSMDITSFNTNHIATDKTFKLLL